MKTLLKFTTLIVFSLLNITSMTAMSAEFPARGPIPFGNYDLDKNGFISEEEFNRVRSERMAANAAQGRFMRGMARAPSFSSFDKDSDGLLTQQELTAGQQAQMQNRRGMRSQNPAMGQARGTGIGRNMPIFSEFDLNRDGVILEQEFYDARALRMTERAKQGYPMRNLVNAPSFTDIDSNGDQKLSTQEFTEHQIKHRQQMRKN